jgi:cysteine desulfurase
VARTLGVDPDDLLFTSGGTEANSLALLGSLARAQGQHLVTTAVEHSSVGLPLRRLAEQGWVWTELR